MVSLVAADNWLLCPIAYNSEDTARVSTENASMTVQTIQFLAGKTYVALER